MRVLAAVSLVALAHVSNGAGAWATGGAGTGSAGAGSLGVAAAPTAEVSGALTRTVTLSWAASPGATGYQVRRYDLLGVLIGAGGTCATTVTETTCAEDGLAPGLTWRYTVTPVAELWRGGESAETLVTT